MHKKNLLKGFYYSNDFYYLKINLVKVELEYREGIYRALILVLRRDFFLAAWFLWIKPLLTA